MPSAEDLVGPQVCKLIIPLWMPISRCAENFKDALDAQQRHDQIVFFKRNATAGSALAVKEILRGTHT